MMKKTVSVLIAAILLLSLCACGAAPAKPEDTVKAFSEEMKAFDLEKMQGFLSSSEESIQSEISDLEGENEIAAQLMSKMKDWAKDLSYEIVSAETDGDKATVEVKYSYVDSTPIMNEFFADYISQAFALAFSDVTDEEIAALADQILADKMETVEAGSTERNVVYTLSKAENNWVIDEFPEDAMHVMTADILIALEGIASALGG